MWDWTISRSRRGCCGPFKDNRALSLCRRKASSQEEIVLTENSLSVLMLCGFFLLSAKAGGQGARLGQPHGALGSEHPTLGFNALLSPF